MTIRLTPYQLGMLVRKGVYNAKIKVNHQKRLDKAKQFNIVLMQLSRDLVDESKS